MSPFAVRPTEKLASVAGRVPVIVDVSDVTTAKTILRAKYAQQAGAGAVMILPVSYWKLTEREIFQHCWLSANPGWWRQRCRTCSGHRSGTRR